jgi:hypothetical protein
MLASMVMLGLQLCFPLTLQASVMSTQQVDMISLGVKDPAGKPGVQFDHELPQLLVVLLHVPTWTDVRGRGTQHGLEVAIPSVLPVAGYHPSAP